MVKAILSSDATKRLPSKGNPGTFPPGNSTRTVVCWRLLSQLPLLRLALTSDSCDRVNERGILRKLLAEKLRFGYGSPARLVLPGERVECRLRVAASVDWTAGWLEKDVWR